MGWAFVFMFVVLKIPVAALLWLVWWSTRAAPDQEEDLTEDSGRGGSHHPRPRRPRPPRRGPHAEPPPRPPARVRVHARARGMPSRH